MAKSNVLESRWPVLPDIKLVPAVARLPSNVQPERRNLAARNALVNRIRSEFQEMPGLSLTLSQAAKLFGVAPEACSRILMRLTEQRLLNVRSDGRYVRRGGTP